jgi:dCMP deaminase
MNRREQKIRLFMKWAEDVSSLSVATRLKVGALAVRKDFSEVIMGFNGAYPNSITHDGTGSEERSLEPGQSGLVHAEVNLVSKCFMPRSERADFYILITHSPCAPCATTLINSGFRDIYWKEQYRDIDHLDEMFPRCGVNYGTWEDIVQNITSPPSTINWQQKYNRG